VAREANGTSHPFPITMEVDRDGCFSSSAVGTTTDGSGYTLQLTVVNPGFNSTLQITLWDRAGNVLAASTRAPSCNASFYCITDSDGVSLVGGTGDLTGGPITDTLGQTLITATLTQSSTGDSYTY